MKIQNEHHSFTGMQRDIEISKHPSSFLYDARNIRLTQRNDDTLLAITNEKGTLDTAITVTGTYLGHCLLNEWLVVFSREVVEENNTTTVTDYIERINLKNNTKVILYAGSEYNLNFSFDHPIEAIGSYENENVQKVYWTDGYNQPRVINITPENIIAPYLGNSYTAGVDSYYDPSKNTAFDFVRTLQLNETVKVKKILGAGGMFPAGVIQYMFTYYDKYGQESGVFYTSPLLYTSHKDRGGSPEDKVDNGFEITINNPDLNFDYIRIYSLMRTSINGTPIAKRVQDIYLHAEDNITSVSYLDVGTSGDIVDPTELLYKGGEEITAQTIEQKDGTLFLGNVGITRPSLAYGTNVQWDFSDVTIDSGSRHLYLQEPATGTYAYTNQLTAFADANKTISSPCSGFKRGDYYRLGVQFQYKTGAWSEPIFLGDYKETSQPFHGTTNPDNLSVILPTFIGRIPSETCTTLRNNGYIKVRPIVVFPNLQDRVTLCQGVSNPTLYQLSRRYLNPDAISEEEKGVGDLFAQSSWFFRPYKKGSASYISSTAVSPTDSGNLIYTDNTMVTGGGATAYNPENIRRVEIQGQYDNKNKFYVDGDFRTFHSPEIEFDDSLWLYDFASSDIKYRRIGRANFSVTMADINIQTKSATISSDGGGFKHATSTHEKSYGWVSGLFWDDYIVDDSDDIFKAFTNQWSPSKWMVYAWNKSGSLNNDISRPADKGVRSSELEKKVISNLRYADTILDDVAENAELRNFVSPYYPKIFSSDQLAILKFKNYIYQGNIDTLLMPDDSEGMYFAFNNNDGSFLKKNNVVTPFTSANWWKTNYFIDTGDKKKNGIYHYENGWIKKTSAVADKYPELGSNKEGVRMKYKTTPHLAAQIVTGSIPDEWEGFFLPIFEIVRNGDGSRTGHPLYRSTMFGGTSPDALQANQWVPCGEPVRLDNVSTIYKKDGVVVEAGTEGAIAANVVEFKYSYGDTYYQRWDCLKTYPFTREDLNQIVEIGSFMLETHVNIDGRYDRNRGQMNNLNMTPEIFNLMNPVYSQIDNFFTYRILDESFYKNTSFPNQITWTKEKQSGADVDLWTNITLASTYDMDGSKGEIVSLNTWKDSIFCFQNKGLSNILFNSRVQIPVSDGVPIEITNSYKVDGYKYIGDGIGCTNKWSIKETPAGIYFIDSVTNDLHHIGEGLTNIALTHSMKTWFKDNTINKTVYDDVNHDVYLVNSSEALCYSEILGQFTGFYDYDGIDLIESYGTNVFTLKGSRLYKMFEGDYNVFFSYTGHSVNPKPWYFTFISNGLDDKLMDGDKIFNNLDFRMEMYSKSLGNYVYEANESFDKIRVWNEYQDSGTVNLSYPIITTPPVYDLATANLEKKYKIWRVQLPREANSMNRIRNPWCKITLKKNNPGTLKAVLQDLNVQYYI